MERLVISENIRPILENSAYKNVPGKGRIKSGDLKRFRTNMSERLKYYEDEKKEFLKHLEGNRFSIIANLTIFVPKEFMYKKDGDISIRKGDCQAYRKCTQDAIFDWLEINDKYVLDSRDLQVQDEQGIWGFEFTIESKLR